MKFRSGFSLVEMVVAIAIISIISGVILFNSPDLNERVRMNRAAREFTSAMRDAQARAVAVGQFAGEFPGNYGIQARRGSGKYYLFVDNDPENGKFDLGGSCASSSECVREFTFNGITVVSILDAGSGGGPPSDVSALHVIYKRPEPRTDVTDAMGNAFLEQGPYVVTLQGRDPSFNKEVHIWRTGQISIR